MACPEYNRLRQLYEAALRRWAHVRFSSDARLVGTEDRQKVFDERSAAKERLSTHTLFLHSLQSKVEDNHKLMRGTRPPVSISNDG
jgi:hypothetical protein